MLLKKSGYTTQRVFYYLAPLPGILSMGDFMLDEDYIKLYGQNLLEASLDTMYNKSYIFSRVLAVNVDLSFLNLDKLNYWIAKNGFAGLFDGLIREDDLIIEEREKAKKAQQQKFKQFKPEVGKVYEDARKHAFIYLGCYNKLYYYYPIWKLSWRECELDSIKYVMNRNEMLQITKQPNNLQAYQSSAFKFMALNSGGALKEPLTEEFITGYIESYESD